MFLLTHCRRQEEKWRHTTLHLLSQIKSTNNKDTYALPNVEEAFSALSGSKRFSVLDLKSGFYQIEVDEVDKHLIYLAKMFLDDLIVFSDSLEEHKKSQCPQPSKRIWTEIIFGVMQIFSNIGEVLRTHCVASWS